MSQSLDGKIAIVTGASRGIGAAIAVEFAKRGAKGIAITYVSNVDAAEAVLQRIRDYGTAGVAIKADASDPSSAASIVHATQQAFGSDEIDILVNNAADSTLFPLDDTTPEVFYRSFTTNVLTPLLLAKSVMPHIRRGGRIINISSRLARVPSVGGVYVYAASKAALENVTRNLATEWAAKKLITVNNVMPGPTDTDAMNGTLPELLERARTVATAEKRLGKPEEIANVVAFIAEDGSRWINGKGSISGILHDDGLLKSDILIARASQAIRADESQMSFGLPVAFRGDMSISLGVDCHMTGPADLPYQMRLALQLAGQAANQPPLDADLAPVHIPGTSMEALNLGTIAEAKAPRMEDKIGSLAEGKLADIVILNATSPRMVCAAQKDPVTAIVRHASIRHVEPAIIDGVVRKLDGKLLPVRPDQSAPSEVERMGEMSWNIVATELAKLDMSAGAGSMIQLFNIDEINHGSSTTLRD
ncbi:hypothetical protein B7463_g8864, partial [Scytalidium lignicola]